MKDTEKIQENTETPHSPSEDGCDGGNVCSLLDRYKNKTLKDSYAEEIGCAVCDHPHKDEIDEMLKQGHSYSAIKEKFQVSKCALELYDREYVKKSNV